MNKVVVIPGEVTCFTSPNMTITNKKLIKDDEQYQHWLEIGKSYLESGFSIIPVSKDKKPLLSWKKYQETRASVEEINKWCSSDKLTGFGIVTGKISGIIVLDIDEGADYKELDLPKTVSVKTGGGGLHFYFKYPTSCDIGNFSGFRHKMDIRGEGGYVIAPPALHPSGNRYEWLNDLDTPIAGIPEWLMSELSKEKVSLSDWVGNPEVLRGVPKSMRNESAAKIVGKLLSHIPQEEWQTTAWEFLTGWNLKNTPPLEEKELRTVFESITKREIGKSNQNIITNKFEGFSVKLGDGAKVKAKKGIFEYHLKQYGRRARVTLYVNKDIIHSDFFDLSSSKSRTVFVNASGKLSDEQKEIVKKDLLLLPEVFENLNKEVKEKEKPKKLTSEEKDKAGKLLESKTLLYDILKIIKGTGVAGEEKNSLIFYLVFTSRVTEEPLSVVVKGESSAGKSYVVSRVMKLFPSNAYIDITDATAQSFFYAPKDHFAHKIILIFEKHGGEKADYSIRSLQSEKKLKIQHTVKNQATGEWETKEKEVDGIVGFITTTTEAIIHSENETRNISIFPDESEYQTEKTFEITDAKYRGKEELDEKVLEQWRNIQLSLKTYNVLIPFVEEVRDRFPKKPIRVRRDYGKILALIAVITLLHQRQREIVEKNGCEYLMATLVDFHIARVLLEDTLKKTIYSIPPKSEEIINAAREQLADFSISEIAVKLDWDYDTANKWFKPAYQKGYFTRTEENKGSKAARYKLSGKDASNASIFPQTEELFELNPKWLGKHKIYDPTTGEIYEFEKDEISTDVPMLSDDV